MCKNRTAVSHSDASRDCWKKSLKHAGHRKIIRPGYPGIMTNLGQNREQDCPGVGRSDLGPCYLSYSDDHVLVEPLKYQDIANLSQGKPHYDMSSMKLNITQRSYMH